MACTKTIFTKNRIANDTSEAILTENVPLMMQFLCAGIFGSTKILDDSRLAKKLVSLGS